MNRHKRTQRPLRDRNEHPAVFGLSAISSPAQTAKVDTIYDSDFCFEEKWTAFPNRKGDKDQPRMDANRHE